MLLGIDSFLARPPRELLEKRWGLLSNQASVNSDGYYSKDLLRGKFENNLIRLFSPQHGFWGTEQDNMIETPDGRDPATDLPLFSLYGRTRRPTMQMLEGIDILLIDLQDVGTRVYTFITTLAFCLQEAKDQGKTVVVLDRPNPIGGTQVEGNILRTNMTSYVGVHALPMRHGMTIGELGGFFNKEMEIGADLQVIRLEGWNRSHYWDQTGLQFMIPSPNMPTLSTALVYPGQVLWEGTNVSEGRGTTRPFEFFGAPFINSREVQDFLKNISLPGAHLLETTFRPTFQKFQGEECRGFFLWVQDRLAFKPYFTTLALLQAVLTIYKEAFQWKAPPYEYETEKTPIDILIGDREIRTALEGGTPVTDLEQFWEAGLEEFLDKRRNYLLYP
ncbi:MAG: DUF1343 domain-containing protein [Thermodesulfobacteriota bacterium]